MSSQTNYSSNDSLKKIYTHKIKLFMKFGVLLAVILLSLGSDVDADPNITEKTLPSVENNSTVFYFMLY